MRTPAQLPLSRAEGSAADVKRKGRESCCCKARRAAAAFVCDHEQQCRKFWKIEPVESEGPGGRGGRGLVAAAAVVRAVGVAIN